MSLGFFGSIGFGSLGANRVLRTRVAKPTAESKQAAFVAKQAALAKRQADAAQKQLTAAENRKNQTAAVQAKEAGLQAKITALQSGQTVAQANAASKQATAAAKTAIKTGGLTNLNPSCPGGQDAVGNCIPVPTPAPYTVTPPSTTPGAGYATRPPPFGTGGGDPNGPPGYILPSGVTTFTPPPMGGGGGSYGGGFSPPPPGGYGGGIPPTGGYSIQPPAGGYAIGGPQAAPGAYTPTQEIYPSYGIQPGTPNLTTLVPQTPYGTAIGPTPYSGTYGIQAPGAGYGIGALGQGGITAYTTPRFGDTKACTNKRTALSKAYQKALLAVQKNPNSKALTNFQKRYPKLVTALQKKCPTTGQIYPGYPQYPTQQNCPPGFSQNPAFNPSLPRNQFSNPLCVMGLQPGYPGQYPGGFQPPPSYPNLPSGSGPQPGETVWQGGGYAGGGYQGGQYSIVPEGTPYAGMAPSGAGGYGGPPQAAVIGPISNRGGSGDVGGYLNASGGAGYADVPITDGSVFDSVDALDPNVLAMSETGTGDSLNTGTPDQFEQSSFSGLGKHHHHGGGRGMIMPVDYGDGGDSTVIILDNRDCSPEDETCDSIGLMGLGRVGRRRGGRRMSGLGARREPKMKRRTLPLARHQHALSMG